MLSEASYKIFDFAKKRVYRFGRADSRKLAGASKNTSSKKRKLDDDNKEKEDSTNMNSVVFLEEVLEEPPKWKVLLVSEM